MNAPAQWCLGEVVPSIMEKVKRKATLWPLVVTVLLFLAFHGVFAAGAGWSHSKLHAPSTFGCWAIVVLAATMHIGVTIILSAFACCA